MFLIEKIEMGQVINGIKQFKSVTIDTRII